MRQLIAGNWKMHGLRAEAGHLCADIVKHIGDIDADLLVCPPATLLAHVAALIASSPVLLGGQDCHEVSHGAHTGDVSAPMLADAGARWVIIGHSERRQAYGETDARLRHKIAAAEHAQLTPILCVGENEEERLAGRHTQRIGHQLHHGLPDTLPTTGCVVAYEPIWAIGTGRIPSLDDIAAMHTFIRTTLTQRFGDVGKGVRILYGGSVKPDNAAEILAIPEVGGALVGGASLQAQSFLDIARAARPLPSTT